MTQAPKQPIICLMGPTASGKTAIAMELVRQIPCEIISVDSALIYRGMDIGTAKPTPKELQQAPHRLIDICDPEDSYSVGQFCTDVRREIEAIQANGNIPLLVGGTMMYFHALQNGINEIPDGNDKTREKIAEQAKEQGWPALHNTLAEIDPTIAEKVHPNDAQRISRALEVYYYSGKPLSYFQQQPLDQANLNPENWRFINCILEPSDRAVLHNRIAQRFDAMLAAHFIDEVIELRKNPDLHLGLPSMRTVGYRQAWQHLDGEYDVATMRDRAVIATRQLAKRQLTWLRRWENAHRFDSCEPDFLRNAVTLISNLPFDRY